MRCRAGAVLVFFSSRRRHTSCSRDWSSDVCSSDLGSLHATVAAHALLGLAISLAVGALLGYGVSRYLGLVHRHTALFLVAVALVAAEVARLVQLETIIVALAAGVYLASVAPAQGERVRHELKRGWPPVYILLFVLAGAGLRLSALAALWPWGLLLVGLRAVSLRYGLLWAGRHASGTPALARPGWLGLGPPAGGGRRAGGGG